MTSGISHIFLDLDGVLVDWHSSVLELFGRTNYGWQPCQKTHEFLGVTKEALSEGISKHGFDFWLNLQPCPWFDELIETVSEFADFSIATRPATDPVSATGKMMWLYKHFPQVNGKPFRKFAIIEDKFRLAKLHTVLIDDDEEQVENFIKAGGYGILFPRIWNVSYHYDNPIQYIRGRLEDIQTQLEGINDNNIFA